MENWPEDFQIRAPVYVYRNTLNFQEKTETMLECTLHVGHARPHAFQPYMLFVENGMGNITETTWLQRK